MIGIAREIEQIHTSPCSGPGLSDIAATSVERENRAVDDLLLAEIAERRADPDRAQRDDILSLLLGARFEDGEGMSDRELRDQLVTLLLAGLAYRTTSQGTAVAGSGRLRAATVLSGLLIVAYAVAIFAMTAKPT